jgi:hypothetical protein
MHEKLVEMPWVRSFALAMGLYMVFTVTAAIVVAEQHPRPWVGAVLAIPSIVCAVAAITVQARGVRRREGVERVEYVETTSVAFIATMLSALAYGFLQSWAGAPHLSAFWVWFYGMGVWGVLTILRRGPGAWR